MAHGSGADSPVPQTSGAEASPDTARAERYLRQLAERELRWADGQPDPPPGPSDGAPVQAPAVRAVDRARNAGGALVAAGTIGEPVVAAILSELVEALVVRSRLPAMHTYRNRFLPGAARFPRSVPVPGRTLPSGPVRVVPIGKPVPFAASTGEEEEEEDPQPAHPDPHPRLGRGHLRRACLRRRRRSQAGHAACRDVRAVRAVEHVQRAGLHRRPRYLVSGEHQRRGHRRRELVGERVQPQPSPDDRRPLDRHHPGVRHEGTPGGPGWLHGRCGRGGG